MAVYESVLCLKQEVFVYRIPARTTNRGYRAAEWKLDEPDWTGRLKVVAKEKDLFIKLEDKTSGELFAQSPIESYPSSAIEQVLDSSRYFVVRIQDGSARHAFIGLGFADRGDSFDLLVAIQDHFKQVKRETVETERCNSGEAEFSAAPKLDLGFKEGQTITLNFATKKTGDAASAKPRPKGQLGASPILLPPPPGGVKISGPPRPSPVSQQHQQQPSSTLTGVAVNNMQSTVPINPVPAGGGMDLLVDLDASSSVSRSAAPHGTNDNWDDFASVGGRPSTQTTTDTKTLAWENFD